MDANWTTAERSGVTLVEGVVRCAGTRRVRVESRLDGPVWPPRSRGIPAAGWDETGFEGVVDGERRLGFATPTSVPEGEAPVTVEWGERVEGDATPRSHPDVPVLSGVDDVLRTLADLRPPRVAVPVGAPATARPADRPADPLEGTDEGGALADLTAVRRRVERAERLADATTLVAATAAVDGMGGVAAVGELADRVAADAERLRQLEREVRTLRERCAAVDVPVAALEGLS